MPRTCYVYIVTNRPRGVLYIGMTNDLQRRLYQHRERLIPGFTKKYNCSRLVYFEVAGAPAGAIAREKELKRLVRWKKIALIERENPTWRDLAEDWE